MDCGILRNVVYYALKFVCSVWTIRSIFSKFLPAFFTFKLMLIYVGCKWVLITMCRRYTYWPYMHGTAYINNNSNDTIDILSMARGQTRRI